MNTHLARPTRSASRFVFVACSERLEPRWLLSDATPHFYLINADTNQRMSEITAGLTIDRAKLATQKLNIEIVFPNGTKSASARVTYDNQSRKDNSKPFSVFGDDGADYVASGLMLGWHVVSATPYSLKSCTGKQGTPANLVFEVKDTEKTQVTSVFLVDAVHDKRISQITNGTTIDLAALATRRLNIEGVTSPSKVGSVQFEYDFELPEIDNAKPYAAFGDTSGNFSERHLAVGEHQLVVTSFSGASGTGKAAAEKVINFEIIDTSTWGTITGNVYNDSDGNGKRGDSESGLEGRQILARTAAGKTVVVTTTDSSGNYMFQWPSDETNNGTVLVKVRDPLEWRTSDPEMGYRRVTISPGQITTDRNFGQTQKVSVTGKVFIDTNGNAIQDNGETIVGGWKVWDDVNRNERTDSSEPWTRSSMIDGTYQLNVNAGAHHVLVDSSGDWRISQPDSIWQNFDADAAGVTTDINFGVTQAPSLGITPLFDWSVPDRYGLDANNNGRIDLLNSASYVNPGEGYSLFLDGSKSQVEPAHGAILKYRWELNSDVKPFTPMVTFGATAYYPYMKQGKYNVTLKITTTDGKSASLKEDVQVRDILFVSLGDSFSSGEGVPDKAKTATEPAQWADGITDAMNRKHLEAHRSTKCASSLAAIALERSSPHFSVTYVQLAASGAEISHILSTHKEGIEDDDYYLPPQLEELEDIVKTRPIDVLTISAGGNNVGYGDIIRDFLLHVDEFSETKVETTKVLWADVPWKITKRYHGSFWGTTQKLVEDVQAKIGTLKQSYIDLQNAIAARFTVGKTMITEYADPTRGDNGQITAFGSDILNFTLPIVGVEAIQVLLPPSPGVLWAFTRDVAVQIDAAEASAIYNQILTPLNARIKQSASELGWQYITGITSDFATHGYAATQHWFRQMQEARDVQGTIGPRIKFDCFGQTFDYNISPGGAHPNDLGHEAISKRIYQTLEQDVTALLEA